MNRDLLFLIALEMDLPEIIKLCETSSKINEYVCNNRNFWINKIKKTYPRVPVDKIQDPRTLYRKLFNTKKENAQWDFWYALREQDNDLVNSLPFIYYATYPNVIVTSENEWKFYDTLLTGVLSFNDGFFPHQVNPYTLLHMIVNNGIPIEKYYDFKNYQHMLEHIRKERFSRIGDEYIRELLFYLRSQHQSPRDVHISLTNILYNYLKEKGQVYPSGTPYEKIYVK